VILEGRIGFALAAFERLSTQLEERDAGTPARLKAVS
jgi:hypothetical protein